MKNISMRLIFGIMLFFLGVGFVSADKTCDVSKKAELMKLASKLSVTYELHESDYDGEFGSGEDLTYAGVDLFYIKLYNLNSKLKIVMSREGSKKTWTIGYKDIIEDGSVTVRTDVGDKVKNYKFLVYGQTDCTTTVVRTIRLTLPRYNYLSKLDKCSKAQDYYLCQELVTFNIEDDLAYGMIDSYLERQEAKAKEAKEEKNSGNTSIVSKTISGVANHRIIFAVLVILAGAVATVLILRKRKSDR